MSGVAIPIIETERLTLRGPVAGDVDYLALTGEAGAAFEMDSPITPFFWLTREQFASADAFYQERE